MGNELLVEWRERPLGQPTVAREARVAPQGGDDRQKEPERGTRLPAIEERSVLGRSRGHGNDPEALLRLGDAGAQRAHARRGGVDVLGGGVAVDVGHAVGEGGADEQPVRLRLGGDGLDAACEGTGEDPHVHDQASLPVPHPSSTSSRSSAKVTRRTSTAPILAGTTMFMASPWRFLSWVM